MNTVVILENSTEFNHSINYFINKLNLKLHVVPYSSVKNNDVYNYIIVNNNLQTKAENLNCSYCLVNFDNLSDKKMNTNIYGNIITYGFGNKNTVTISSMSNENLDFIYCLQRNLNNNSIGMLEPVEIPIHCVDHNENGVYAAIAVITISLIEGIDINYLKKVLEK